MRRVIGRDVQKGIVNSQCAECLAWIGGVIAPPAIYDQAIRVISRRHIKHLVNDVVLNNGLDVFVRYPLVEFTRNPDVTLLMILKAKHHLLYVATFFCWALSVV